MKKILIPTDFSDNAYNAAEYAIQLYGSEKTEFVLLHSYEPPNAGASSLVSITDILEKNAREDMRFFEQKLKSDYPTANISTFIKIGSLNHVLDFYFTVDSAYSVVMGSKGSKGAEGFIFGSNALAATKSIRVPLLIVPETYAYNAWKQVVLASDFMGNTHEYVKKLEEIIAEKKAKLTVLHVKKPDYHLESKDYTSAVSMIESFKNIECHLETLESSDVTESINDYMENSNADVLALVAKDRPLLKKLFHKSVSRKFAGLSHYPLIIFKEHED